MHFFDAVTISGKDCALPSAAVDERTMESFPHFF